MYISHGDCTISLRSGNFHDALHILYLFLMLRTCHFLMLSLGGQTVNFSPRKPSGKTSGSQHAHGPFADVSALCDHCGRSWGPRMTPFFQPLTVLGYDGKAHELVNETGQFSSDVS